MTENQQLTHKLFTLLGYTDIVLSRDERTWYAQYKDSELGDVRGSVPDPMENDGAAMRLVAEHGMVINALPHIPYVVAAAGVAVTEEVIDHPDKATALRVAVVKALIAKLEAQ